MRSSARGRGIEVEMHRQLKAAPSKEPSSGMLYRVELAFAYEQYSATMEVELADQPDADREELIEPALCEAFKQLLFAAGEGVPKMVLSDDNDKSLVIDRQLTGDSPMSRSTIKPLLHDIAILSAEPASGPVPG